MSSDAVSGLLFAALGTYAAMKARTFGLGTLAEPGAGFFPFWGGVLVVACSLVIVARTFKGARADELPHSAPRPPNWSKISACVAVLFAYTAALPLVGFGVSTFLVMLVLSRFDPRTTWRGSLAIAALGALGFWLLFVRLLAVSFPSPAVGF